jgi:hypothetical protein
VVAGGKPSRRAGTRASECSRGAAAPRPTAATRPPPGPPSARRSGDTRSRPPHRVFIGGAPEQIAPRPAPACPGASPPLGAFRQPGSAHQALHQEAIRSSPPALPPLWSSAAPQRELLLWHATREDGVGSMAPTVVEQCPRCGGRMVVRAVIIPPAVEQSGDAQGPRRPGTRRCPRATRRRRSGGLSAPHVAPDASQQRARSVRVGRADEQNSDAGGPAGGESRPAKDVTGARASSATTVATRPKFQ